MYHINREWDKDYDGIFEFPLHTICKQIMEEGLCLGKNCEAYEEVREKLTQEVEEIEEKVMSRYEGSDMVVGFCEN